MQTKTDILQSCKVEGFLVKLPPVQLDRRLYQEVAKDLELIGGEWKGGKIKGFVFQFDPSNLLRQIANCTDQNLKKEYQFFSTPDALADELVENAGIEEYDLVLEPSAGQGAIIKAIKRKHPSIEVYWCELMDLNRGICELIPDTLFLKDDFLEMPANPRLRGLFHKIIANPPFAKNQDIDHIMAMWECLAPGGRIVTIAGVHWQFATEKKCAQFRRWLEQQIHTVTEIPEGTFKESGTNVRTVKLILDKPQT